MDKFDQYKAAALTGILSGVTWEPKVDCEQVTADDLLYLDLLCTKIANQMVKTTY